MSVSAWPGVEVVGPERVVVGDDRLRGVADHDVVVQMQIAPLLEDAVLRVVVEQRLGLIAGRGGIEDRLELGERMEGVPARVDAVLVLLS
jgi:hypothetical protein